MNWLEITVETEAAAVETVSAILHEHGEGGVAVYQQIVPEGEDGAFHYDTAQPTCVTTYVPATAEGARRREAIAAALGHLTAFNLAYISPLRTREVAEEDWANAWKEFYHPLRFGRRLVVKPSWRDLDAGPDDLVIELDPGMAFGTGLHQTTAMCLALLEDELRPDAQVLDQGAGSGILSIAAALLGAARVVAVDVAEVAVAAVRENAARNGLGGVITALRGSSVPGSAAWHQEAAGASPADTATDAAGAVTFGANASAAASEIADRASVPSTYNLIVANIIADVIINLASDFYGALTPGGTLIASGIIHERDPEVQAALHAAGFTVTRRETRDEWVALVARR